jgi:hypothetical protein
MPDLRALPDQDLETLSKSLLNIVVELGDLETAYGAYFPGAVEMQNELNDIYFRLDRARKDAQLEQKRRLRAAHRSDW